MKYKFLSVFFSLMFIVSGFLALGLSVAQSAIIDLEQPIFAESVNLARQQSFSTDTNGRQTIYSLVGVTDVGTLSLRFNWAGSIEQSQTLIGYIQCTDFAGVPCPPETNRINSDGMVLVGGSSSSVAMISYCMQTNSVAFNANPCFTNFRKHRTTDPSYNPLETFDISNTLHDWLPTNIYTIYVETVDLGSGSHTVAIHGTNTDLTPDDPEDISNLPIWQQTLLGLAIQLDSTAFGAGSLQLFSQLTSIFFKPYALLDGIDTDLNFQTIATTFYSPTFGNTVDPTIDDISGSLGSTVDSLLSHYLELSPFSFLFTLFEYRTNMADNLENGVYDSQQGVFSFPVRDPSGSWDTIQIVDLNFISSSFVNSVSSVDNTSSASNMASLVITTFSFFFFAIWLWTFLMRALGIASFEVFATSATNDRVENKRVRSEMSSNRKAFRRRAVARR